jgi:pyruvyltransferase
MQQLSAVKIKPLKLHWSSSKPNFGDWLSPALVAALSSREIQHAHPADCDLIAIGSILDRACHRRWFNRPTHVWGAGFIEEGAAMHSPHRYHAVRGWLTARRLRGVEVESVGDPGLLVGKLLPDFALIEKSARIGIIPHYKEWNGVAVRALASQLPGAVVVDTFLPTMEFLKAVATCEVVLSSSLHGLIVADAFGIPNAWIRLSDLIRGGDFKYQDYYSAFDLESVQPWEISDGISPNLVNELIQSYARPGIEEIQNALLRTFPFPASPGARRFAGDPVTSELLAK